MPIEEHHSGDSMDKGDAQRGRCSLDESVRHSAMMGRGSRVEKFRVVEALPFGLGAYSDELVPYKPQSDKGAIHKELPACVMGVQWLSVARMNGPSP